MNALLARTTFARRASLAGALALAASAFIGCAAVASEPVPPPRDAEGFYFLAGDWQVQHRKLKDPFGEREEWNDFQGSASFRTLVDGMVSVEELRDAKGKPIGGAACRQMK